jgi:hypothetical protein
VRDTTPPRHDPLGFYDLAAHLRRLDTFPADLFAEMSRQRDEDVLRRHAVNLTRRWTASQRATHALRRRYDYVKELGPRVGNRVRLLPLRLANLSSRESILDPKGPTVTLTTQAHRVGSAHLAIESIARGTLKPGRLILWVSDDGVFADLPAPLRHLQSRGLEIRLAEELGPHTKYFPYLESTDQFDRPLVTADDDVVYPRRWLQELVQAHAALPQCVHCHRVRHMSAHAGEMRPYNDWPFGTDDGASHHNFILGVGGAIYPAAFLARLKGAGRQFLDCCPTNDDVWLTVNAVRLGFKVRQVRPDPMPLALSPGTQGVSLSRLNLEQGANQIQLRRTFTADDLAILRDTD